MIDRLWCSEPIYAWERKRKRSHKEEDADQAFWGNMEGIVSYDEDNLTFIKEREDESREELEELFRWQMIQENLRPWFQDMPKKKSDIALKALLALADDTDDTLPLRQKKFQAIVMLAFGVIKHLEFEDDRQYEKFIEDRYQDMEEFRAFLLCYAYNRQKGLSNIDRAPEYDTGLNPDKKKDKGWFDEALLENVLPAVQNCYQQYAKKIHSNLPKARGVTKGIEVNKNLLEDCLFRKKLFLFSPLILLRDVQYQLMGLKTHKAQYLFNPDFEASGGKIFELKGVVTDKDKARLAELSIECCRDIREAICKQCEGKRTVTMCSDTANQIVRETRENIQEIKKTKEDMRILKIPIVMAYFGDIDNIAGSNNSLKSFSVPCPRIVPLAIQIALEGELTRDETSRLVRCLPQLVWGRTKVETLLRESGLDQKIKGEKMSDIRKLMKVDEYLFEKDSEEARKNLQDACREVMELHHHKKYKDISAKEFWRTISLYIQFCDLLPFGMFWSGAVPIIPELEKKLPPFLKECYRGLHKIEKGYTKKDKIKKMFAANEKIDKRTARFIADEYEKLKADVRKRLDWETGQKFLQENVLDVRAALKNKSMSKEDINKKQMEAIQKRFGDIIKRNIEDENNQGNKELICYVAFRETLIWALDFLMKKIMGQLLTLSFSLCWEEIERDNELLKSCNKNKERKDGRRGEDSHYNLL